MLALHSLPDWLPPVIAEWIRSVDAEALDQDQLDALRRLVTDERMKRVWDDLRGRQPACSRAALETDLEDVRCPIANLSDLSEPELALLATLPVWFTAPSWDILVCSAAQLKARIKSLQENAARLRSGAEELPLQLSRAVREAARWCDEKAKHIAALGPADHVVRRDHGFLQEIDLVHGLIGQMQALYGEPLLPTVTILASVLTGKPITSQQVRDWHKLSRKWQDREVQGVAEARARISDR